MGPVNVITEKIKGDGAVHSATVDIHVSQFPRQLFCKGAFATAAPAVDGDDDLLVHGALQK